MSGASMPVSPRRGQRKNSPFTKEQETWIVLEFGAIRNCLTVKRKFRSKFKVDPRNVPSIVAFERLVERFFSTPGHVRPALPTGRSPLSEEIVQRVREHLSPFVERGESVSLRKAADYLHLSYSTVWRVVRKRLGWYPYRPRCVVSLSEEHKKARKEFCTWLLRQSEEFPESVIWSDEKWFCLHQAPNKQNERYWASCNPEAEIECKVQGDKKVMCWAGVIQGGIIIHWFDPGTSVNGDAYLAMLRQVMWPKVQAAADDYWFQQDGATVHTTIRARVWLQDVFGNRVISRLTERPWPARSPDLSPLDYWFWSVALAELRRRPPTTLAELKDTVEAFARSLDEEEVKQAVRHIRTRARACLASKGAAFEANL